MTSLTRYATDAAASLPSSVFIELFDLLSCMTRAPDRKRLLALALPTLDIVGEGLDANFLVFVGRVERGVLAHTARLGDGGQGRLAVGRLGAVHHREDRVRPIRVRGPKVTTADGGEAGGDLAEAVLPIAFDDPGAHRVGRDSSLAV